ncbi:DUF5133 domain-containing protein [Streptomyces sp. NPDC004065]|uniref:DUF5133 domain-containing protein n=1 Tax=Streptomyces sp. NPDC004065 TaxID=3364689 RepID=UPI00384F2CB9
MPHPEFLRRLVDEYEAVLACESADRSIRAQDLAYTLCVTTGTREVGAALEAARHMLAAAAEPLCALPAEPPAGRRAASPSVPARRVEPASGPARRAGRLRVRDAEPLPARGAEPLPA